MHLEVLCTGDELLTGLTADTNSPFFMEQLLSLLGLRVSRVQVVGDVKAQIAAAVAELAGSCDVVLVSGGLGPTADDLTVEAVASAAGRALVEDAQVLEALKARFARRGLAFTANNAKQALVPEGAEVVPNPVGTAPMLVVRIGRCDFFLVPGVPREYRHLVEHEVLPRLRARVEGRPGRVFRAFRLLRTVGLPESHLDARVAPLAPRHPRVEFGFRTHLPENHLKLLAQGATQQEADDALAAATAECRQALAPHLFGEGEKTLAQVVGELLVGRGLTLAVAESCTGGKLSELCTAVPGASQWFAGGAVTYQALTKEKWAAVSAELVRTHGEVSREVALAMARGVRTLAGATCGLATTGFAGPQGGTAADPLGTVYCALSEVGFEHCERLSYPYDRERVQLLASAAALDMLRRRVLNDP